MEKLNKDLQTVPWHNGEAFDDTDDIHFLWQPLFTQIVVKHLPLKLKDAPFMKKDWKAAIKKNRKYARLFAKILRKTLNWKKCWKKNGETEPHPVDVKLSEHRGQKFKWTLGEIPGSTYSKLTHSSPFTGKKKRTAPTTTLISRQVNHLEADQKKVAGVMANYFTITSDCIWVGNEESNESKLDKQENVVSTEKSMDGNSKWKINQTDRYVWITYTRDLLNINTSKKIGVTFKENDFYRN